MVNIQTQVKNILHTKFNLSEAALSKSESIIEDGLLSSIEFVQLTIAVESIFDIELDNEDFSSFNFKNAASIADLICRKKQVKTE